MLIDTLIDNSPGWYAEAYPGWLSGATVFDIQNIYDWHRRTWPGGTDMHVNVAEEAPNVAPLGDLCWYEFTSVTPAHVVTMGILVDAVDMCGAEFAQDREIDDRQSIRWVLHMTFFRRAVLDGKAELGQSHFRASLAVGEQGNITGGEMSLWNRENGIYGDGERLEQGDPAMKLHQWEHFGSYLTLMAICFAHCKGVTVRETGPTRNDRRRAERTGSRLPVIFKTLDIRPVTRIIHDAEATGEHGVKWHMVRGHFSTYTPDAPLFGKHVGTYYRQQHARGSMLRGTVNKRYRSHAEGAASGQRPKQQSSKPPTHAHV
jgi:hypothetical protein